MTNARTRGLALAVTAVLVVAGLTAGQAAAGGDIYITVDETHKIPDKGNGKLKLTVPVSGTGTINNMFVGFRVEHPQTKDLKLSLKSPEGIKTVMSNRDTKGLNLGAPGTGCGGTLMILFRGDTDPLSSGTAPYAGSFGPSEPFEDYDGEEAQGDWTMTAKDLKAGNKGKLRCFVLSFYTDP
jgi:hypothetical protein